MIPAFIIEEHNEAFYYWHAAIEKGYIPDSGNTLFHIDHHDDLETGGYNRDFSVPFKSLEEIKKFTYEELGIADFIVPALYTGIFSRFFNMKALVPKEFQGRERFVKRLGKNVLILGEYFPFFHSSYKKEKNREYAFFSYYEGSLSETGELDNIVLDIDLDYFCWDDSLKSVSPKLMEITKGSYEEYMANPYHFMRILPRRLIKAKEMDGRFFIIYEEPPVYEKEADWERIEKRMERFFEWLKKERFCPKLITICRSAKSGYLPQKYAALVEEKVKRGLEDLYKPDYKNN